MRRIAAARRCLRRLRPAARRAQMLVEIIVTSIALRQCIEVYGRARSKYPSSLPKRRPENGDAVNVCRISATG